MIENTVLVGKDFSYYYSFKNTKENINRMRRKMENVIRTKKNF